MRAKAVSVILLIFCTMVQTTESTASSDPAAITSPDLLYARAHCESWDSHIKIERFETSDCTGDVSTPTYAKVDTCESNQKYIVQGTSIKMELYPDDACEQETVTTMLHNGAECITQGDRSTRYTVGPTNHKVVIYEPHTTSDCSDNVVPMILGQDDCTSANTKFVCLENNYVEYAAYDENSKGCNGTPTTHTLSTTCKHIADSAHLPVDGQMFKW